MTKSYFVNEDNLRWKTTLKYQGQHLWGANFFGGSTFSGSIFGRGQNNFGGQNSSDVTIFGG